MQSAKQITNCSLLFTLLFCIAFSARAQENSPYSRYGLGDIYPSQTIGARAMGGATAAYSDGISLNSENPATYGDLRSLANGGYVTYDIGVSIDTRTLRSAVPVAKYNSTNFIPSYVLIGFPLNKKHLGMVFGIKPMTRINYSIITNERKDFDSVTTLYQGNGGLNQAFIGVGKRWKNFSLGVNAGYVFGRKEISTKVIPVNDSISYYKANVSETGHFGGLYTTVGAQWNIHLGTRKDSLSKVTSIYGLRLGAEASLKQNINVNSDVLNETYTFASSGATTTIDTVSYRELAKGKVSLPGTYTFGVMFNKVQMMAASPFVFSKWMVGGELQVGQWGSDYRYMGKTDAVTNSWMVRAGGEFIPSPLSATSGFWGHTAYRLGFYTGKDYTSADGQDLNVSAITFGAGFLVRKFNNYNNQLSRINTALEIGKRGTNSNNITESFFKVSVGLSLSDIWFIKRKYE